jgi:hypothetical protein
MKSKLPQNWDLFRRVQPRQFTRLTRLCAKCGARVRWDDKAGALACPRCKETY